MHIWRY